MNTLKYYKENYEKIFNSIENPNWRIWKAVDEGSIFRQNKVQITTPKRLWDFIRQCKNPQKLYVSASTFLNPHRNHGNFSNQKVVTKERYFYPRAGYTIADCIVLDSYLFIDLDSEEDLKIAQEDARKIINHMGGKKEYTLHMIQFSGTKGIHLIYKADSKRIKNPLDRIKYYRDSKERLSTELIKLNLKTMDKNHLNIMKDVFRIYAAPYSLKPNGDAVTPINLEDFMEKDIYTILCSKSLTRAVKQGNMAIEAKADEAKAAAQPYQGKKRDSLSSCPIHFKFVDNMIHGARNNYITVLKLYKKGFNINKLKELQKLYNLSNFCIVGIGDYVYAYNTKALQFQRVVKIMIKAKSKNLSFFLTRKHCPIQITDSFYANGEIADKIEYIGTLKSKYGLVDDHSRYHSDLFGLNYVNLIGDSNRVGMMRVS